MLRLFLALTFDLLFILRPLHDHLRGLGLFSRVHDDTRLDLLLNIELTRELLHASCFNHYTPTNGRLSAAGWSTLWWHFYKSLIRSDGAVMDVNNGILM